MHYSFNIHLQPASRCNKLDSRQQTTTNSLLAVVQNMIVALTKNKSDAHIKPNQHIPVIAIYSHTYI